MKLSHIITILVILTCLVTIGIVFTSSKNLKKANFQKITTFDECIVTPGALVMESYPRICKVGDVSFVELVDRVNATTSNSSTTKKDSVEKDNKDLKQETPLKMNMQEKPSVQNDDQKNTLYGKSLVWIKTQSAKEGSDIIPPNNKFIATFSKEGRVSIKTDCNSMSGTFTQKGKQITIGPLMSTMMYCEGSMEAVFSKDFQKVITAVSYPNKEWIFDLPANAGPMVFKEN